MKKIISIILSVLMLTASLAMMAVPASAADNAAITPDATWYNADATTLTINDAADLLAFVAQIKARNTFHGKTVELAADIDLNPGWTADINNKPTNEWNVNGCGRYGFWGTFDGKGHTISGIYSNQDTYQYGLFGNFMVLADNRKDADDNFILENVTIKNVAFVNSVVAVRGPYMGGLYGDLGSGQSNSDKTVWDTFNFENVYNGIDLIATTVSSVKGADAGAKYVGGFVGRCDTSSIHFNLKNCVYAGKMDLSALSDEYVGGYIGDIGSNSKAEYGVKAVFENCAYYGNVKMGSATIFGCFAANNTKVTTLKNCVAAGIMASGADDMDKLPASLIPQKVDGSSATGTLYTDIDGLNAPFAEEVSTAPEGTTHCTHSELIGAGAKMPAEGWTATAGYPMPTALYTLFKAEIDAQTPAVPEGTGSTDNNDQNEDENKNDDTKKDDEETDAPETKAPETKAPETTAEAEKGGCGSVVALGAVAIVGVAAAAVTLKKKED